MRRLDGTPDGGRYRTATGCNEGRPGRGRLTRDGLIRAAGPISRGGAVVWHRPRPLAISPRYLSITSIDRISSKAIHFFTMRNRRSNVTTSDTAPQVVTYPSRS